MERARSRDSSPRNTARSWVCSRLAIGNAACIVNGMTMTQRVARWGGARLSRRLSRSLPWIGGAIALATVASTMRKKGVISGALDTGLNAVPLVGAAKNVLEVARGRDFFPDRYGPAAAPRAGRTR